MRVYMYQAFNQKKTFWHVPSCGHMSDEEEDVTREG